jgi:type IV pilus assembly protein PilV
MTTTPSPRGFTLLEVLIAIVIFSFGMLGLAALQAYSVKTNQSAHLRSEATALAGMMMDSIRANRTNVGAYYSNSYEEFDCDDAVAATPVASHDLAYWRQRVNCTLPQGRGAVAPLAALPDGGVEIAVCLRWSDARWETEDGDAGGSCTDDATEFGAGLEADGPGAGTDGQFSVFVVTSRF